MGKASFYFGAPGSGARMKLCVNMVMGSMLGALGEGLALCDRSGLEASKLLEASLTRVLSQLSRPVVTRPFGPSCRAAPSAVFPPFSLLDPPCISGHLIAVIGIPMLTRTQC